MKKAMTFLFLMASGTLVAAQGAMTKPVTVDMHDGAGKSVGSIMLAPAPKGVSMMLHLTGLPAGVHAIHVHQTAKCEGPGFTSAGGHFNPAMKHHGLENPEGPHAGDIPNFTADANGNATATIIAPGVTLGDGENSMLAGMGTAIVIHAGPDDNKSDPAGNAGGRIACGVVVK